MFENFPLFPDQASTTASKVDGLYAYLVGISAFFSVLIFLAVMFFAIRYRRKHQGQLAKTFHTNVKLEIVWSVVPLVLALTMFGWGATVYFEMWTQPREGLDVYVVGKQWMWNLFHAEEGQKELNELHVPVGRKIRLTMISEDVIHSFFVPAFRVKADVLPGKYTRMWFEPTKPGRYHLYCAEYCGTKHSEMKGSIVVLPPVQFEEWLSGGSPTQPLETVGERLFEQLGCKSCHGGLGNQRGPALAGIYGREVALEDGRIVVADEEYLRRSILNPKTEIVAGFEPLMPTFEGQVSEEQLLQLISYLKSLEVKESD